MLHIFLSRVAATIRLTVSTFYCKKKSLRFLNNCIVSIHIPHVFDLIHHLLIYLAEFTALHATEGWGVGGMLPVDTAKIGRPIDPVCLAPLPQTYEGVAVPQDSSLLLYHRIPSMTAFIAKFIIASALFYFY